MTYFESDAVERLNTILTTLYYIGVKTEIEHDGNTKILIIETYKATIKADITNCCALGMVDLTEVLMLILINFGDRHINEYDGIMLDNEGVLCW